MGESRKERGGKTQGMLRRKANGPVYGVHGNKSRKKGEGRIRYEEVGGKGAPRRKNSMCESPEEG